VCFFLRSFQQINSKFTYLFQEHNTDEESDGNNSNEFTRSYGWLYNAKMVSEFENISINEVWNLGVLQFLNDLSYLKMKRRIDDEQEKRMLKKNGHK